MLKTTLVSAAWAAVKTKGSYFQAQFQRLRARRGPKKAIIAVAASMLTAAYYILRDGVPYKELGSEHFTRRNKEHAAKHSRSASKIWFHGRSPSRDRWSFYLAR